MPGWRAAGGVGPYGWCGGVLSTNRGLGVSAAGWAEQRQRHPAKNEQLVEPVPLG